jgi:hypothetical protein
VVVKLIAEFSGHTKDEIHEEMKKHFLQNRSGNEPRVRSTSELSTLEFTEYVERCVQLGAEMGIIIPPPGEWLGRI